jgi:hypothetical protein
MQDTTLQAQRYTEPQPPTRCKDGQAHAEADRRSDFAEQRQALPSPGAASSTRLRHPMETTTTTTTTCTTMTEAALDDDDVHDHDDDDDVHDVDRGCARRSPPVGPARHRRQAARHGSIRSIVLADQIKSRGNPNLINIVMWCSASFIVLSFGALFTTL